MPMAFMMASVAAMKAHMEAEHGYEGKTQCPGEETEGEGVNSTW